MERTLIRNLGGKVSETVSVSGWVDVRRDHGKLIFIDIRDMTGIIQTVVLPNHKEAHEIGSKLRSEWVVTVEGIVNKRPEKMVNAKVSNGDIELEITKIEILSEAHDLPFEKDTEVNIDTLLDYRPFTLRSERSRDIFNVQATILEAYRNSLKGQNFTEFQAPALVGGDAEGGAAVFKVNYFYEKQAYLATSPQLYKQIMVGVFERVFTIARIFRAEKSATTRHLSELTQMDFEMGFIKNEFDVLVVLEKVIRDTIQAVTEKHKDVFERFKIEAPKVGEKFPVLTLREAQKILGAPEAPDLEPEQERKICEWALEKHNSDFVFITRFPTAARAFYTMADPEDPTYSRGFDLLFRGLEINSGAERIHKYDEMVARMKERGLDPNKFEFYLQSFKYGLPPHGGCSTGLERITARMLNLANVKEAAPFPRDLNRIDLLLSEVDDTPKEK